MKPTDWKKRLACAAAMGILTLVFCLVIADGVLGIKRPGGKNPVALWVFWFSLVVLPILFYRLAKWRDTLLNLPLYFLLYFPIHLAIGPQSTHYLLDSNSFLKIFPAWIDALFVAFLLWSIQSLVYLLLNSVRFIVQKLKGK